MGFSLFLYSTRFGPPVSSCPARDPFPGASSWELCDLGFHSCPQRVCTGYGLPARSFGPGGGERDRKQPCWWRVKAFDVHEALSAQAAKQRHSIACDLCSGRGWLQCDFCNGKKTDVPAKNGRIYRRCPSCRAVGVLICAECKVHKCVTFPDGNDGGFDMD